MQTNPEKTVEDLRTPNNAGIQIFAVDVVDQPEQVNLGDATDDASPADDAVGISVDSRTDVAGGVSTYSANALGNTVTWNGQTFDLGPATVSVDDEVMGSGYPPIQLPQGNYTSIQILAMEGGNVPTSGTFYVDYSNGTSDSFTLGVSSWTAGYDGAATTAAWESVAASMAYYNASSGRESVETYLYGYVLPTNPALTVVDLRTPNNNGIRILAIDVVDQPAAVDLDSVAATGNPPDNITAITTNYDAVQGNSGIDGSGDVYSANALGGSSLSWNSQTFVFGPTSISDAVDAEGQTIALPEGYYTSIQLLGTATGGTPQSVTFTVNYVGGGTATFTQTFSDWKDGYDGTGGTTAPGESIAKAMTTYNTLDGTESGDVYLYGYVFAVNPAKMVASIEFPSDSKVKVLAIDEVNQPPQVNLGNAADGNPATNVFALTFNNTPGNNDGTGLDGSGDTYSLNALASVTGSASMVTWNSQDFNFGPIDVNDAIAAAGQTIVLPQGYFTSIEILGTATGGSHQTGTITVNYVGGGTATFTQSFSDWMYGYNGTGGTTAPGESIAVTMTSYNTSTANTSGDVYLYGYVFSTSTAEPIASIQLPNSTDGEIKILAIDEINASQQSDPEDGVIEGDAMVAGNERLGTPVTKGTPVALVTEGASVVPPFGEDLVSSALDEITTPAAPAPYFGEIAAGIGPNWAGSGRERSR